MHGDSVYDEYFPEDTKKETLDSVSIEKDNPANERRRDCAAPGLDVKLTGISDYFEYVSDDMGEENSNNELDARVPGLDVKPAGVSRYFDYISNEMGEENSNDELDDTYYEDHRNRSNMLEQEHVTTKKKHSTPISVTGISVYDEYDCEQDLHSHLPSLHDGYYQDDEDCCPTQNDSNHSIRNKNRNSRIHDQENASYEMIMSIRKPLSKRRAASPTGIANLYDEYE